MTFNPKPDVCQPTGTAELPMLDIYMPMMKSAAIVAAARLGVFEALSQGGLDAGQLAQRTGADGLGVRTLADFLVALGYLLRDGEAYANTASTQRWLTSAGAIDYTPGALWTYEAWAMMGQLDSAVKAGRPAQTLWERMSEEPYADWLPESYRDVPAHALLAELRKLDEVAPERVASPGALTAAAEEAATDDRQ